MCWPRKWPPIPRTYNAASAAAGNQDRLVKSLNAAANQAGSALSQAQSALQKAQATLTNTNTALTQAQTSYTGAMGPANALAAEEAKISNLLQQAAQFKNQANSTPAQVQYDIFTVGAGYLDIEAAVKPPSNLYPSPTLPSGNAALSPVAFFNSTTQKVRSRRVTRPCAAIRQCGRRAGCRG